MHPGSPCPQHSVRAGKPAVLRVFLTGLGPAAIPGIGIQIETPLWSSAASSMCCPGEAASAAKGLEPSLGRCWRLSLTSAALQPYFPALLSVPVSSPRRAVGTHQSRSPPPVSPHAPCPPQARGSRGCCRASPAQRCPGASRAAAPAAAAPCGAPAGSRRRRRRPRAPAGCCASAGEPQGSRPRRAEGLVLGCTEHPPRSPHFGTSSPVTPLWNILSCHPNHKYPVSPPHFGASSPSPHFKPSLPVPSPAGLPSGPAGS